MSTLQKHNEEITTLTITTAIFLKNNNNLVEISKEER